MSPHAQKHVTHNETLQLLDAVAQLTIAGLAAAPPQSQAEGACYLIDAAASGAWAGKSGPIALRVDWAWVFIQPRDGWRAWFQSDTHLRSYQGGQWQEQASAGTVLISASTRPPMRPTD